ncbi:hypothetical protein D3C76_1744890 [compost metagenome]
MMDSSIFFGGWSLLGFSRRCSSIRSSPILIPAVAMLSSITRYFASLRTSALDKPSSDSICA